MSEHERKLRDLLDTYGMRVDGSMTVLIERLGHALASFHYCIKAHEVLELEAAAEAKVKESAGCHNAFESAFAIRLDSCDSLLSHIDKVAFFKDADLPDRSAIYKALRLHSPVSFVFLSEVPDFMLEMAVAGYKVFSMAPDTTIPIGAKLGKKMNSATGERWVFDSVGITEFIKLH